MLSEGIVTVSYKTYRNTYQISQYVSFVEKVYRYTPIVIKHGRHRQFLFWLVDF